MGGLVRSMDWSFAIHGPTTTRVERLRLVRAAAGVIGRQWKHTRLYSLSRCSTYVSSEVSVLSLQECPSSLLPITTTSLVMTLNRLPRLNTLDSEQWNHEQAQTIVLGALLVVIALLMLAVSALECYRMKFYGLTSRHEYAKVTPAEITPPYSSSSSLAILVNKSSS
ncbi:hypothetical protein KIN20_005113 [Parelaphostrongylus tenuis]|uniref:Uncharacterized protein n=1 Tax=Parelaphostrongylus tenuis TaxID=148309 RepID=A0AAD5QFP6_PARTN|nr:hypothetical protein KIN20_005113 [Parelaphostrongylus tenuis]